MTARKLHTVRWPPDGTETTKCIDVQSIHKTVFLYGCKQTYKQPLQCIYTHYIYICLRYAFVDFMYISYLCKYHGICMQGNNYRNFNKLFTCIDDSTTYEFENLVDVRNKIYVYYNNLSTRCYSILPIYISKLLQSTCSFTGECLKLSDKCSQTLLKNNMLNHIHWTSKKYIGR